MVANQTELRSRATRLRSRRAAGLVVALGLAAIVVAVPASASAATQPGTAHHWGDLLEIGTVPTPQQVGDDQWLDLSAGSTATVGVRADGSLWIFGSVTGGLATWEPTQVGDAQNWRSVSAGSGFALALNETGELWAWGQNGNGELGVGDTDPRPEPTRVGAGHWRALSASADYSVGIDDTGALWAWGDNTNDVLGAGAGAGSIASPRRVAGAGTTLQWRSVSASSSHVLAVTTDGQLWSWGANGVSQLGRQGDSAVPGRVGTGLWATASAGGQYSTAVAADGSWWTWGYGYGGQRCVESPTDGVPTRVGTGTDWVAVEATDSQSTFALDVDGRLFACGRNLEGQLGLGTFSDAMGVPTPTEVPPPAPGQEWVQVSGTYLRTVARAAQPAPNEPPVADAGLDLVADEGDVVVLQGLAEDPENAVGTVTWTPATGLSDPNTLTPTFTVPDDGVHTLTLTVCDRGDPVLCDSDTMQVTARNVPPAVDAGADLPVSRGEPVTLSAVFTDPGPLDVHTATVDWGDGSPVRQLGAVDRQGFSAEHTFTSLGERTVQVCVRDDDVEACDTVVHQVGEAPPTVGIQPVTPVVEPDRGAVTPATVRVVLSRAVTAAVTVRLETVAGTALPTTDYQPITLADPAGLVTFAPGTTEQVVSVGIVGDEVAEGAETFVVRLAQPVGATVAGGQQSVSIPADGDVCTQPAAPDAGGLVIGTSGNDVLCGGPGNDTFDGAGGNDRYLGAAGLDRVTYRSAVGGVDADLVRGTTIVTAVVGGAAQVVATDTLVSIERLTGSPLADRLSGTAGPNALDGSGGDDVLVPRGGVDTVVGGTGVDRLAVGDAPAGVGMTINLATGVATGWGGQWQISTVEDVFGTLSRDVVTGSSGPNVIVGNDGNDEVNGGGGNDTLVGQGGQDRLDGGDGADDISGGEGPDLLFGGAGWDEMIGGDGVDVMSGQGGNDTLYGNLGNDRLGGGDGNDTAYGLEGDDALQGNAGNDTLYGGDGIDSIDGGAGPMDVCVLGETVVRCE